MTPRQVDLALWHAVFKCSLHGTASAEDVAISDIIDAALALADEAVVAVHAEREWTSGKGGWSTKELPDEAVG